MKGEAPIFSTLNLLGRMDKRLGFAVREALHASASFAPPRPLGLEIFLCALYRGYPNKMLQYVRDAGAFERLKEAFWPARVNRVPEWFRKRAVAEDLPDTNVGWHTQLESDLVRILENASRISVALRRTSTSIPDLVASIATEEAIYKSLKQKWGISIRGDH